MKYYKVRVLGGHMGGGNTRELIFYIKANSIMDATAKARKMPGVKHDNPQAVQWAEEVTKEEYDQGRQTSAYKRTTEEK